MLLFNQKRPILGLITGRGNEYTAQTTSGLITQLIEPHINNNAHTPNSESFMAAHLTLWTKSQGTVKTYEKKKKSRQQTRRQFVNFTYTEQLFYQVK